METLSFSEKDIDEIVDRFMALTTKVPLRVIETESQYDEAVRALNALLDWSAAEGSPVAQIVALLGDVISDYDEEHFVLSDASPSEVLRELMSQHRLKQSELREIGSQGVVSEVLNGKRKLTASQIEAVSRRFGVSPAAFFPRVENPAGRAMELADA